MENFIFHVRTKMYFGKGEIVHLPEILSQYGKNVLMVYGGGSIKRNGIYDEAKRLMRDFCVCELAGVEPNPRIDTVTKGAKLCREHDIDVILAVGGGSTIDCSKMIAAAACYDGDAWELVKDKSKIGKCLPLVTILTMAATGSEMNKGAVISNPATKEKIGGGVDEMIPMASICDPTYTYTLPPFQTASGTADIMSHVLEGYFKKTEDAYVQDQFAEGILKTCIKYGPIALKEPENYSARANLMWASSMALNGLCGSGKGGSWSCHAIEHELSAFYDITHGAGLAVITPKWMRYVLSEETVEKFCDYARNVWNLEDEDPFVLANKGIDATERFFIECGLPSSLSEMNIDDSCFDEMAAAACRHARLNLAYKPLDARDVKAILKMCL